MLLGFLDGRGRAYDLNFRTLKRRLKDAEGNWELEEGETLGGAVSVEAALFLETPRAHLLLRPTGGAAYASDRRLVFVASAVERTPDEPTAFNVAIHVPPTAVEFLFRASEGREVVEVRRPEIRETTESGGELALKAEAPWVNGAPAGFRLILRPLAAARDAVRPLRLS